MGIFVPQATLPSGIKLSNVYMSFSGEVVYTAQFQGKWRVQSNYKVFKDQVSAKNGYSNIRIEFATVVDKFTSNPYICLYDALKQEYPGAVDVIDLNQTVQTSNLVISTSTLASLQADLSNVSNISETSNLVISTDIFSQISDIILRQPPTTL
jgi:hypothetical protein